MLKLDFNALIKRPKNTSDLLKAIQQYLNIMKSVDPEDPYFQKNFSDFYQINNSGWKSPAIMRPLFFNVFSAFNEISKHGCKLNYEMIVTMLSKISGMPEKSFASKMLHTFYNDKPIIDSKVIGKIKKDMISPKVNDFIIKTGYPYKLSSNNYTLAMAIALYKCLEKYYNILKSAPATKKYLVDFDNWCNNQGIKPSLISDTKKIDFWMWLA